MHIVVVMGIFVILADIVDHLHILVIVSFESLSTCELHAESVLENQANVLAALGQSNEESWVETIFFADFLGWRLR